VKESSRNTWAVFVILKNLPKVGNRQKFAHSGHPVTVFIPNSQFAASVTGNISEKRQKCPQTRTTMSTAWKLFLLRIITTLKICQTRALVLVSLRKFQQFLQIFNFLIMSQP
jgi:hypothetical protein